MTHYYEKNIVEIKNEYTEFLLNILTPLLFEGIKSIYDKAVNIEEGFKQRQLEDPSVENPGVFKIFQICLRDINNLNTAAIESETNRIKERSKCSEWFDSLVKSTIKSHIVLLTFNSKNKKSKIVEDRFHEKVDINLFIHKCYIECSRIFFNYPELFWHHFSTLDIKRNQREIYDLIKDAVKEAIKKTLPIKLILDEYLKNDYDYEDDIKSDEKFIKIKKLLQNENKYFEESVPELSTKSSGTETDDDSESETSTEKGNIMGVNKILDSDEQEIIDEEMRNIENDIKNSEKIEEEGDELMSQISQSVNINNLVLNTSVNEADLSQPVINPVINNVVEEKPKDQYLVSFQGSGKKKNEVNFFKDELSRYKLSQAPTNNQSNNPPNVLNNEQDNINLTVKKNITTRSDKNEFFNSMMK